MISFADGRRRGGWVAWALLSFPAGALAQMWDMRPGVTAMSQHLRTLHHMSLWVCVVVGIVVFGAMFYTIFAQRAAELLIFSMPCLNAGSSSSSRSIME